MNYIACSLRNFNIGNYSSPIEIKDKEDNLMFYLIFKDKILTVIPNSYNYKLKFGTEEVDRILSNVVCLALSQDHIPDLYHRRGLVNNFYSNAEILSNALWFIKDNSVTPYFTTFTSEVNMEPIGLRRNKYFSNADCSYNDEIVFSNEEINESMSWFYKLEDLAAKRSLSDLDNSSKKLENLSNNLTFNSSSFQRAIYFLNNTRITDFLPAKIAGYISILETFYAVSGNNAHKTSERTAALIGETVEEKIELFDQVKEAYNIRSMYIHGSHITDKNNRKLPDVSINMDQIARRVFKEMLLKHQDLNYNSSNNSKVDKLFDKMVLSMR